MDIKLKDNKYTHISKAADDSVIPWLCDEVKYIFVFFNQLYPNTYGYNAKMSRVCLISRGNECILSQYIAGSFNLNSNIIKSSCIRKCEDTPLSD